MATIYPVWRGSLTYHDGTLSHDGAALYRGTVQGQDDPAPEAISAITVGLTTIGIDEGNTGEIKLTQRANASGVTQWASGSGKLTCKANTVAIADAAMGDVSTISRASVTTMGDLLAMGALDMSTQISVAGLDTGEMGAHALAINSRLAGIYQGAASAPTIQQILAPSGVYQQELGSHKASVRQVVGDLVAGELGDVQLAARLQQAATTFTGAVGTPIAKYAQILYPLAPAVPVPGTPAMTIRLSHDGLTPPAIEPFTTTTTVTVRGLDAAGFGANKVHRLPLATPATRDLLPPSASRLEHLTAATLAYDLTPEIITSTRFADTCPAPLLPWLAWARSVDWWELAESEDQQRALIKASYRLHQRKGTPWAIKEALNVLGFGDSAIIERATGRRYDGTLSYNGNEPHGDPTSWAVYRVILTRPVTTAQANRIKRLLAEMAPARCHLSALDYTSAPITYNGAATYNGNYNHGAS
ncbi:TPA: phage tail protein I [Aeromonas hydrophila]